MAPGGQAEPNRQADADIFLTPDELIVRWKGRICKKTLANWRGGRNGPKFKRFGNRILYRLDWVREYEDGNGYASTQDYGKKMALA